MSHHCESHEHGSCCNSKSSSSSSCTRGCNCQSCHRMQMQESENFSHKLLEVADAAWMEVLKEKMKHHINASCGAHLDELAKVVTEANSMRWQGKMHAQAMCHEYESKIQGFFSGHKCNKC